MNEEDPDSRRLVTADLRMVPPAVATWAGAWCGTSGSDSLRLAGLLAVVATGLVALLGRARVAAAVGLLLASGLIVGSVRAQTLAHGPVADWAGQRAVVQIDVVVTADPQRGSGSGGARTAYVTVRARAEAIAGRGSRYRVRTPVLVVATGEAVNRWQGLIVGSRVSVAARLEAPDPGDDVAAVVRVRGPTLNVVEPGPGFRLVERVRQGLRDAVASRPAEPRALVPALVLGDTSAMTDAATPGLQQDFQSTGLTHLTAVSGANLTLLLAFVLLAARWAGVRGWWLRALGLAGVAVFVALCRTEPSVLRAAAMGLVTLAALGTGGRRRGLRHLAVAAAGLLLLDPYLSRSLGFTLSVLASAGIVVWAGRWSDALERWTPRPVAESVAVPLAAHLATLPVVASISGQVSMSGLLANAIAGPAVGPATVLGFAAAGLSLISPTVAAVAGWAASWCAQLIITVARAGAAFPGSSWRWPAEPVPLAVLGVGALLVGLVMAVVLARWWLAVPVALAMVAGLLSGPVQPGWPPPGWAMVACDIGQGDSLVLRTGPGEALLVDAGPDPVAVDRCLDQLRVRRLALVVLTHFHADHVDGLSGAVTGRTVGPVWVSPLAAPASKVASVEQIAAAAGAPVTTPVVGERLRVGTAELEVIGPVGGRVGPSTDGSLDAPESSAENDSSLVLRVVLPGLRVLLTGDVEPEGQRRILATGVDLSADVLKVPHHGSARQEPAFFAATGARVAIASAGEDNDYGHPAPRTVQLAAGLGMTVLRTDQQGAVAVIADASGLHLLAQR